MKINKINKINIKKKKKKNKGRKRAREKCDENGNKFSRKFPIKDAIADLYFQCCEYSSEGGGRGGRSSLPFFFYRS